MLTELRGQLDEVAGEIQTLTGQKAELDRQRAEAKSELISALKVALPEDERPEDDALALMDEPELLALSTAIEATLLASQEKHMSEATTQKESAEELVAQIKRIRDGEEEPPEDTPTPAAGETGLP